MPIFLAIVTLLIMILVAAAGFSYARSEITRIGERCWIKRTPVKPRGKQPPIKPL